MEIKIYMPKMKYNTCGNVINEIPEYRGYIELDHFDRNECFHLCNWDCWTEEKPKNVHTDIESVGHGIIFVNPETKENHLALSAGWLVGNSVTITDYIRKHKNECIWL